LPKSKNVLVTGGAGFIGSHVVDRLVNEGYNVRVIDNLSTGKLENIQRHIDCGSVDFVNADIRDGKAVEKSVENVDIVVHLAALVSVPLSVENPDLTFDINLLGTLNLLRASANKNIDRFVFISSCAVCGNPQTLPVSEKTTTNPLSPYAESKLVGENYCLGFHARQLLPSVVLRFFNVYGSRQGMNDYSGVITRFIERIKNKEPLVIYGDGLQTRDFVNVKDVADAVFTSATGEGIEGEVFNVGTGNAVTINELATTLLELSGSNLEIKHENPRSGDIKDSYADISKAKRLLGFKPKVTLKRGLQALLEEELMS
jgi:UDP-glucose 4-epimerase